jgi:CHASE2 domain-containing sensor protein
VKTGTKLGILALALAVGSAALWFYLAGQVNLPEDRTVFVVAFLSAAALGIAAFVKGTGWFGAVPSVLAIVVGCFLTYTIIISPQEVGDNAIKVGETIPHFTARNGAGELFDSASLHGHLVLIKFFRAHW